MKVTVFKVGDLSYPDANLDKPVRYTESFLKDIACSTSSSKLTGKHGSNTGIGSLSNFIFDDGVLLADVNTEESLEGMGFSPEFNCDLLDKGDYYESRAPDKIGRGKKAVPAVTHLFPRLSRPPTRVYS